MNGIDNIAGYTLTVGTADFVITDSIAQYDPIVDNLADGDECSYKAQFIDPSFSDDYETGRGTWNAGAGTISRTTIKTSSNNGSIVDFGAGPKVVFIVSDYESLTDMNNMVDSAEGAGSLKMTTAERTNIAANVALLATRGDTFTLDVGAVAGTVAAGDDGRFGSVDYGDLPAAAALDRTEIVAIDQGGDGVQTTVGDILDANMFGGMVINNNAVAEGTVGVFPAIRIVQAWTANDPSNFIVPDYTAGTLTVPTGGDGAYFITANIYTYTGSNSKTYTFAIFKNTGPFGLRACSQLTSGSGAGSNLSMSGVIDLVAGDVISLYVLSSDGGTAMTVTYGDIFMQRMGA